MVGDGLIDLPKDVVFDILLRLPVNSIGRFKCVCRNWYDAIESREFREHHYALQTNSTLVVENNFPRVAKIFAGKNLRVVGNLKMPLSSNNISTSPCRGLFLFRDYQFYSLSSKFGLSNPATRAFRLLPRMPFGAISSVFYPFHNACGLGWDPVTHDYKVIYYLCCCQIAAVYSLNKDSWRLLVDSSLPKLSNDSFFSHDPLWNIYTDDGFCYWLSSHATRPTLLSFNVAQEKFETVILPHNVTDYELTAMSTHYNSLALLACEEHYHVIEVWVLRREQQQYWTKAFSFAQTDCRINAIGIWNNTHVLLRKYVGPDLLEEELFMYDMKNDHRDEDQVKITGYIRMNFLNYKKSLFSVKGGNKDWTAPQSSNHIAQMLF